MVLGRLFSIWNGAFSGDIRSFSRGVPVRHTWRIGPQDSEVYKSPNDRATWDLSKWPFHGLKMGVALTTYKSWDDPPSSEFTPLLMLQVTLMVGKVDAKRNWFHKKIIWFYILNTSQIFLFMCFFLPEFWTMNRVLINPSENRWHSWYMDRLKWPPERLETIQCQICACHSRLDLWPATQDAIVANIPQVPQNTNMKGFPS